MEYWNNKRNVEEYIKISDGYDGRDLIEILKNYLPEGSSILELGMGSGKDLDILNKTFRTTGTDISTVFVEKYKKKHQDADVFVLDAITLKTERKFDCIYSNKALQHLTKTEFKQSLKKQKELLNPNGLLFHSLWQGDKEETYGNLLSVFYTKEILTRIVRNDYKIIEINYYLEMEEDDSLYMILKKIE